MQFDKNYDYGFILEILIIKTITRINT